MKYIWMMLIMVLGAFLVLSGGGFIYAGDLDDGISKYKDESISADDTMGKKDTNINFIILDATAEAKKAQKRGDKNANYNDGSGDSNQNSVVVGAGASNVNVFNIIEK